VLTGALAALAAALCWTLASSLWHRLPTSLSAVQLNLLKNLLALVLLAPALALQPWRVGWDPLLLLAASGVLGIALGDSLYFAALRRLGTRRCLTLDAGGPAVTAVAGVLWLAEWPSPLQWLGVGVTTVGLSVLSWPREGLRTMDPGALLGLAAAAFFALSMNGYRQAGLALEPRHPIFAGIGAVVAAQAIQSVVLGGALALLRPADLRAVFVSWRASLGAGACGAGASVLWFSALAMSPPGPVRAIGVIEAPIAALAGRTLFRERLTPRQLAAGAATALGVVVTALA
jgi:drug/metabolite transporter (DMT)-like permease